MTTSLRIYRGQDLTDLLLTTDNPSKIQQQLATIGVGFEQWPCRLTEDAFINASDEALIAAYQLEIDQLVKQQGYQTYDLIQLSADHPDKAALRQKFLNEHTHSEDEVRFFIAGEGLFSLHINQHVYEIHCLAGDLIRVPANTKHWFDMGPNPDFAALRFFNNSDGWVAQFTGDTIADRFNRLNN